MLPIKNPAPANSICRVGPRARPSYISAAPDSGSSQSPRMAIPPGVPFWAQTLPHLAAPPITLYALLQILARKNILMIGSFWLRAMLYVLAMPLYIYFKSLSTTMKHRRDAWRLGAKTFPVRPGSFPLHIDLLYRALQALPHEYAADFISTSFDPKDRTFQWKILGETKGSHPPLKLRWSSVLLTITLQYSQPNPAISNIFWLEISLTYAVLLKRTTQ